MIELIKDEGKYFLRNNNRICRSGCTLEELTKKDLYKIYMLITEQTKEKYIWLQTKKGQKIPIVWWKKPTKEQIKNLTKYGYEIKEGIILYDSSKEKN